MGESGEPGPRITLLDLLCPKCGKLSMQWHYTEGKSAECDCPACGHEIMFSVGRKRIFNKRTKQEIIGHHEMRSASLPERIPCILPQFLSLNTQLVSEIERQEWKIQPEYVEYAKLVDRLCPSSSDSHTSSES